LFLKTQELRTTPVPFGLVCFSDTIKGPLQKRVFVVLAPDGTVVEPVVAKRFQSDFDKLLQLGRGKGGVATARSRSTPRLVCGWTSELAVVYHLRDSAILSGHKERVYADEGVVAIVVSSGAGRVFYPVGAAGKATVANGRRNR
jgi:hypothetical protein